MTDSQKEKLAEELRALFNHFGLDVAVGLTREGVAIRSQTSEVDAENLTRVTAFEGSPYP